MRCSSHHTLRHVGAHTLVLALHLTSRKKANKLLRNGKKNKSKREEKRKGIIETVINGSVQNEDPAGLLLCFTTPKEHCEFCRECHTCSVSLVPVV